MNTPIATDLEHRIERALHERADLLRTPTLLEQETSPSAGSRRTWRGPLLAAAIVATLVVVVALARPFTGDPDRPSSPSNTTVPVESTTTLPPRPTGVVGPEVPLELADTFDTRFLIATQRRRDPASRSVAVQIPGFAPVVVTGASMWIADAPPDGTGYQGAGALGGDAATRIIGTTDTGANMTSPTRNTYGVWAAVPPGAAYVTMTNGDQHAWQRPVSGVSYFAVPGGVPAGPVVYRAFDIAGQQIGEARP